MTSTHDHRELIHEASASYLERDPLGDDVLECRVLVGSDRDEWRVEWLLACGGPTVRVWCDSRTPQSVEFLHSWGMAPDGTDRDTWDEYREELIGPWQDASEMLAESHCQPADEFGQSVLRAARLEAGR